MGNQICCEDYREQTNPIDKIDHIDITKQVIQVGEPEKVIKQEQHKPPISPSPEKHIQSIGVPELYPYVKSTFQKHNFFQNQFGHIKPAVKSYGGDVYQGELDHEGLKPDGFGKMHKQDGSLFIGKFQKGKAQGKGVFIFPDGSFYQGEFANNSANCNEGRFESANIKYIGGFKNNTFDGPGKIEHSQYTFEGTFNQGKKSNGNLKWKVGNVEYDYKGAFNENEKFHGKGVLVEELGTYIGDFSNGLKHGNGVYKGNNGVSYKGSYKNDLKDGEGTIYNFDHSIAYEGEFKNGLPHGKGVTYVNGKGQPAEWIEGIDSRLIQTKSKQ